MGLKYQMVKIPATQGSIAEVVRDDINGATIVVASGEMAAQVRVKDLVEYLNELNQEEIKNASDLVEILPDQVESAVNS